MCWLNKKAENKLTASVPEWAASHPAWVRLEDQLGWYDNKSTHCQNWYKWLKFIQISLAVLIPVLRHLDPEYAKWTTSIAGSMIAVLEGIQHLNQYSTLWVTYRATAERLKHEKFLFLSAAGPYKGQTEPERLIALAERVEEHVSAEHANWFNETKRAAAVQKQEGKVMAIARPKEIVLGNLRMPTPVFFPSISTIKTALTPAEYLATLHALRNLKKQFLVSAFDLSRSDDGDELAQCLIAAQEAGATVLMDSGNYESYWKGEKADWRQSDFHDVLRRFACTFAFGFDEQNPPMDENSHVKLVVERWRKDQAAAGNRVIVPIVHGTAETLPNLCARIAHETQVPMIAVAERRLGDGVFERTRSVVTLREKLDGIGSYVGLHLLGTGNPISIALYSWAGADSFDGLEWCQTVVDHDSGLLYHLSQSDFFRQQTAWGEGDISFHSRTLAHNLTFYADWMQRLRQAVYDDNVINFCRFNFPPRVFRQCAAALKWEV